MERWTDSAARRLDEALAHPGTWLLLALGAVVAAVIAALATHWARPTQSAWAFGIYMGLVALTLLAVLWYSFETRKLVRIQREAAEIESHPWLHVAGWPSPRELSPQEATRGDQHALPIINVGRTPALVTNVSVIHERPLPDSWVKPGGDANARVLAPGQQFIVTIATFQASGPSIRAYLSVTIDYRALQGGGGQVVVRLRYADGAWKSRGTEYSATSPSGRTLSGQPITADVETAS